MEVRIRSCWVTWLWGSGFWKTRQFSLDNYPPKTMNWSVKLFSLVVFMKFTTVMRIVTVFMFHLKSCEKQRRLSWQVHSPDTCVTESSSGGSHQRAELFLLWWIRENVPAHVNGSELIGWTWISIGSSGWQQLQVQSQRVPTPLSVSLTKTWIKIKILVVNIVR